MLWLVLNLEGIISFVCLVVDIDFSICFGSFFLSISHACTSFLLLGTERAEPLPARAALPPITTLKFIVAGDAVGSE